MNSYQISDIVIKIVTLFISAGVLVYGISSYKDKSDREFKKPFVAAQIDACIKITEAVSEVAQIADVNDRAKHSDKLWSIYFSHGALFLNREALSEYRSFIEAIEKCPNMKEVNECHHENYGGYQFNIANACRNELVNTWKSDPGLWVKKINDPLL